MKHLNLTIIALLVCFLSFGQAPITGPTSLCDGYTITLADATPGGTWSSTTPAVATVGMSTGIVTGLSSGVTVISYTVTGLGTVTTTVTVFPLPAAISGTASLCPGTSTTLSDATTGGTWSSGSTAVAVVGSSSGIVTGIAAGVSFITYSLSTGCSVTRPVTVNVAPGALTGSGSVCVGSSTTWTVTPIGGAWSASNPSIASPSSGGVITGVGIGTTTISYTLSTGCFSMRTVTVTPSTATLYTVTGGGAYCAGGTGVSIGLTGSDLGVSYQLYLGSTAVGSPVIGTGGSVSFGLIAGAGTYTVVANPGTGCATTMTGSAVVTIDPLPTVYTVTGGGTVCPGSSTGISIVLAGSAPGVMYQLYLGSAAVGSPIAGTGAPLSFGTYSTAGTYTVVATNAATACTSVMSGSAVISVSSSSITVSAGTTSCGGYTNLIAIGTGIVTYAWSPSLSLSCPACSTTVANPAPTTQYTVAGTDSYGCIVTDTVTVDGNRISGYISYTGGTSSDTFLVWLIHYNPTDSSIIATDSTYTCWSGGMPYYEFLHEPAGSYMVKAKLLGTVPGTSGYIPTYSLSTSYWYAAATATHTTGWDSLHINMIYGTVPSGPGFISGYVYAGAGKGTTGDYPEPDVLVYLKDGSGNILTYTYTDAAGAYSFTGLAYGSYVIFPTEFDYYTVPATTITLSSAIPSVSGLYYKKHTSYGVISPLPTACCNPLPAKEFSMYPNPSTGDLNLDWTFQATGDITFTVFDVTGREVFTATGDAASGHMSTSLGNLQDGIYQVTVNAGAFHNTSRVQIHH